MKSKSTFCFKSFDEMKALLRGQSFSFPAVPPPPAEKKLTAPEPEDDATAFRKAMEGVSPIPRDNRVERGLPPQRPEPPPPDEETEPVLKLRDLVQHGMGFEVADTPEYIEGTMYQAPPEIARRLHQGDFSIQAYVDLHRFQVAEAKETLERFLKWAVTTGKTGVLIVHGRGLSSSSEPVLKQKVVEWLTRGPWRKWVMAYATARSCDGGAGATYVLLRRRPVSKRQKKGR
jgi:DNA-nicking Smr family endonuclease